MHRLSFQSLLALSALASGIAAHGPHGSNGTLTLTTGPKKAVTVVVKSTVTTCPSPIPPPPCSDIPGSSVSVTATLSSSTEGPSGTGIATESSVPPGSSVSSSISSLSSSTSSVSGTSTGTSSSSSGTASSSVSSSLGDSSSSASGTTTLSSETSSSAASSSTSISSATSTSSSETSTAGSSTETSSGTATSSGQTSSTVSSIRSSSSTSASSSSSSESSSNTSVSTTSASSTSSSSASSSSSITTEFSSTTTSSSTSTSSTPSSTTSSVAAPACTDYWFEKISHQGVAPFGGAGYEVFRNVKDYGAKGDGATDDTEAINRAISDGNRCGPGCTGSTETPGLVYFPPGTYMVSSPIIDFYYTQLIGNPGCMPVLKATSDFNGRWLLDTNQYQPSGGLAWGATNVFWRQVANFVIDITNVDSGTLISGIHWPSSQATSLSNIVFKSSDAAGTKHQGLFIEEGSGGYIGDLVFYGGAQALSIGNQQFTMRNISVHNAHTAIEQLWSWGWTYKGVSISNCSVGFEFTATATDANTGAKTLGVAQITILDSEIRNTPVGITYGSSGVSDPPAANSFVFENMRLDNVATAIQGPSGTVLAGSSGPSVIEAWGRGHEYTPSSSGGPTAFEGPITANARPASLVAGTAFYERSKPQYENVPLSEFVSARDAGAKGDATTDDTDALNALFASAAAAGKIVYLDAGMYLVTKTVHIPPGSRIFGEAFPVILSSGAFFASASDPQPVVQVGTPGGPTGRIEWSNTILSTRGAQPGAILLQYNLASPTSESPSGLWDVHVRVGGFAGSDLQLAQCAKTPNTTITAGNLAQECIAAFMSMHITPSASGLYLENVWVWVADHDIEIGADNQQITVYAGRGLLIEGSRLWLVGTSVEHHQLYEYQLVGARDVFMGQIQTETAYYQPNPDASLPFAPREEYHDPVFTADGGESGWGLRAVSSTGVLVYGAGLYSFFDNYDVSCSQVGEGARCQARTFSVEAGSQVRVYNLNTVGTKKMVTVDGVDVVEYEDNIAGFVHSVALFGTD